MLNKWTAALGEMGTQSNTNILLPMAIKVAAKTIANGDPSLLKEAEDKVIAENRKGIIDAILNDNEFTPIILEETEEYKKWQNSGLITVEPMAMPTGQIFYIDYKYDKKSPK